MMKRLLLLFILASYTQNIMPMLPIIPNCNTHAYCLFIGCQVSKETDARYCKTVCCFVGARIDCCPCIMSMLYNSSYYICDYNVRVSAYKTDRGNCNIDCCCVGCAVDCLYPMNAPSNVDNNSMSDVSSCEDLGNIKIDGIDVPRIGMSQEKAC